MRLVLSLVSQAGVEGCEKSYEGRPGYEASFVASVTSWG